MNNTIVTDALEYYDKNNEKYREKFKNIRFTKFVENNNDMEHNVIIMYDNNKKELFRSRYEVIGLFNSTTNIWTWAWAIPSFRKNNTNIVRKIMNYGAELDPQTRFLKMELITSRFRISNNVQLDIHASIASYLSKNPIIYNHYTNIQLKNISGYTDVKKINSDNYTLYFLFLLDSNQFNNSDKSDKSNKSNK